MKRLSPSAWVILGSFAVLAVGGFWLGAFAWFGGYIWVKQLFGWSALAIGIAIVAVSWRAAPRRWPLHIVAFASSQVLFVVTIAAGQVFYVGPSDPGAVIHTFGLAMRGEL